MGNIEKVSMNFVGDIMLGDSYNMTGLGVGSRMAENKEGTIFNCIAPYLKKADINVGNFECTFPLEDLKPGRNLITHQAYYSSHALQLKEAGFDVMNMANNHTMQYGSETFNNTEDLLNKNQIKTVGTLRSPGQCLTVNNVKIAILGYSLRPNETDYHDVQYMEGKKEPIIADIKSIHEENDHVIVSLHWGDEYVDYPDEKQVVLAHDIIDAGASLVIGHHPHVLQGIEHYGRGVIAYSLGNFVFDKPQKAQKTSMILNTVFTRAGLEEVHFEPVYINSQYQPVIAEGGQREEIAALINGLNKKISGVKRLNAEYDKDVARGLKAMRKQFNIFFLLNLYRFPASLLLLMIKEALGRRLGKS